VTGNVYSAADKRKAVENLIEDLRWARNDPALPENWTLGALKALALDLRAAEEGASNRVLDALSFHVNAAMKAKAQLGYVGGGHYEAVANELLAHWPVVRRALEKMETEKVS
jgi:hypothetical protein